MISSGGLDSAGMPLGLSTAIDRTSAVAIVDWCNAIFVRDYGERSDLKRDLDAASTFFNPIAQGQRLRRSLAEVAESDNPPRGIPPIWYLEVGAAKWVLTPEGVAGLHTLEAAMRRESGSVLLTTEHASRAAGILLSVYREWSQQRIRGVVRLLRGDDKPLQIQAAGVLIGLLVNNNVGPENALKRYGESQATRRDNIDSAFFAPVVAFAELISPGTRIKSGGLRLISGWPVGEVARRLGSSFVSTSASETDPGLVYVTESGAGPAIELLARDLSRGNRKRPTLDQLAEAFDAFVREFRQSRAVLAGYGELHESPTKTSETRQRLLASYSDALDASERSGSR